jgi:hypothetical protein
VPAPANNVLRDSLLFGWLMSWSPDRIRKWKRNEFAGPM